MKAVQYIISRYPIFLVLIVLICNYLLDSFDHNIGLSAEEIEYLKPSFLINEIFALLLILYMWLHVISRNDGKAKFCNSHKLGIIVLASFPVLNIVAILTPFDFTFYNSALTQIAIFSIIARIIYLIIKGK